MKSFIFISTFLILGVVSNSWAQQQTDVPAAKPVERNYDAPDKVAEILARSGILPEVQGWALANGVTKIKSIHMTLTTNKEMDIPEATPPYHGIGCAAKFTLDSNNSDTAKAKKDFESTFIGVDCDEAAKQIDQLLAK